ncbi:MAG TPA: RtcB family protein, partial [Pirellulales bacterium]|nr:RtcB family protein [Pirellulales bacterium]
AAVERILAELFGVVANRETLIHSNHNHVRRETHAGQAYWVHRKGALSAARDEPGVIPGSMGSASFHVMGRGEVSALCSSSHGAGRACSRGEASKKINVRRLEREMQGVWFDHRQAALLRDEAPSAYKDIQAVMRAQRDLTRIERELRPLLSYKGV